MNTHEPPSYEINVPEECIKDELTMVYDNELSAVDFGISAHVVEEGYSVVAEMTVYEWDITVKAKEDKIVL